MSDLIYALAITAVVVFAIFGIVALVLRCKNKCSAIDAKPSEEVQTTENVAYRVERTTENGIERTVLTAANTAETEGTEQIVENENEDETMTPDCSELEKKVDCLAKKNEELEAKLAEYEAAKNAANAAAAKEANEREMYEAMQRLEEEQYQPSEEQLADIVAQNKEAELNAIAEELFERMIALKGDELAELFAEKMKAGDEELFKAFIQKIKENYDPALIKALMNQYDAMVIDEKVQPIIVTVRETTTEQYEEEQRKKKQAFSDAVDSALCAKLCPKAKEEPEAEAEAEAEPEAEN